MLSFISSPEMSACRWFNRVKHFGVFFKESSVTKNASLKMKPGVPRHARVLDDCSDALNSPDDVTLSDVAVRGAFKVNPPLISLTTAKRMDISVCFFVSPLPSIMSRPRGFTCDPPEGPQLLSRGSKLNSSVIAVDG